MHNLRRFYYQNKQKIWKVVLIIAFLLGIIYLLDKKALEDSNKNLYPQDMNNNINYYDDENKTYISDKSAISGGSISKEDVKKINHTISKFLQYCKNENYQEAYNMISSDCRQKKYQTLEKFIEKYAKAKINKSSVYEIEEWIRDTYRISILEDKLATGNAQGSKKITEYITIVEENSQEKLNINGYVKERNIGKVATQNDVKITVIKKEEYLDNEIYNLNIENLSNKTIKLDVFEKSNTIYLEDSKGNKYNAYKNEIFEEDLVIEPKRSFNISIKFANEYTLNRNISQIIFSNFILDYDNYQKNPNRENIYKFVINL